MTSSIGVKMELINIIIASKGEKRFRSVVGGGGYKDTQTDLILMFLMSAKCIAGKVGWITPR